MNIWFFDQAEKREARVSWGLLQGHTARGGGSSAVIPALLYVVCWGFLYVCTGIPGAKLLYGREMHVRSPAK